MKNKDISILEYYENEFDDKFYFIVSNNIDDLKSYNNAKSLYVFKKLEAYYNPLNSS